VPDETGRLVFREGALVTALRAGQWLVLDELNLAPTEVLEALNRSVRLGLTFLLLRAASPLLCSFISTLLPIPSNSSTNSNATHPTPLSGPHTGC